MTYIFLFIALTIASVLIYEFFFSPEKLEQKRLKKLTTYSLSDDNNNILISESGKYQGLINARMEIQERLCVVFQGKLDGEIYVGESSVLYIENSMNGTIHLAKKAVVKILGNLEGKIIGEDTTKVENRGFIKGDVHTGLLSLKENSTLIGDGFMRKMELVQSAKFNGTVTIEGKGFKNSPHF